MFVHFIAQNVTESLYRVDADQHAFIKFEFWPVPEDHVH